MSFFDKFKPKQGETAQARGSEAPEGKYAEPCALCGNPGTEKKWMGQYFHKKCARQARKAAKGMI